MIASGAQLGPLSGTSTSTQAILPIRYISVSAKSLRDEIALEGHEGMFECMI